MSISCMMFYALNYALLGVYWLKQIIVNGTFIPSVGVSFMCTHAPNLISGLSGPEVTGSSAYWGNNCSYSWPVTFMHLTSMT